MGKKASPERRGVRDIILETALHLFTSRGYFNTSVHDIQAMAGVSIGSIYNHFGGKEGVARALYTELLERVNALVDAAVDAGPDAPSRWRELVHRLFELTERDPRMMGFVLNARHREFLPDEPPICSSEPFTRMRDIIRDGMDAGELRAMDPMVAASCAFGPALRMISLRLDGLVEQPLPDYTDAVCAATWRAIEDGRDGVRRTDAVEAGVHAAGR